MKVSNEFVRIRTGNKEKIFRNLILNNYLKLYADSFLEFKDKTLNACLINFTHDNNITEDSTSMGYDLPIIADSRDIFQKNSPTQITTEYYYRRQISGEDIYISNNYKQWFGSTIKDIGFAHYDYGTQKYKLYAYLNVSAYNVVLQENQPLAVVRQDKVTSDYDFWSNSPRVNAPFHLSTDGFKDIVGFEATYYYPKLYSIGFGELPYSLQKEYKVEELDIIQNNNVITINGVQGNYLSDTLYMSSDILMSDDLLMREATWRYLAYVFHLWKRENPESDNYIDSGLNYVQYLDLRQHGKLDLSIKYERN